MENKVEPIKGTPFCLADYEGQKVIILGDTIVSGTKFNTMEEAEQYIKENIWDCLLPVIIRCIDYYNKSSFNVKIKEK